MRGERAGIFYNFSDGMFLAPLSALLLTACAETGEGVPQRNVILMVVDTLRADHLSSYGYSRTTSPNLDAFAAANLRFANVRSQAACTSPSVSSLLASKNPLTLLQQPSGHIGIPKDVPSLAQFLKLADYWTVAISASPIVRKTPSEANRFGEFDAGFDVFHEECFMSDARCVNDAALEALEVMTEPFFLYLHYMDVHGPYNAGPQFLDSLLDEVEQLPEKRKLTNDQIRRLGYLRELADFHTNPARHERLSQYREYWEARYDAGIRQVDFHVGNLRARLEDAGLWDDTLVIVTSDHGEELCEHDLWEHTRPPLLSVRNAA